MRSSKSRSRNKSNRNRNNNNNTLGNVVNRVFDSSGPEGKVRGTPQQIIDKYNQLARDASLSNDRVAAENFQQHAEHYMRMLSEAQREQDTRREQQERENRERQAQRDRERTQRDGASDQPDRAEKSDRSDRQDRQDRQDRPARQSHAPKADEQGTSMAGDVLDLGAEDDGPGLVDTPESRAETTPAVTPSAEPKPAPTRSRAPRSQTPKAQAPKAQAADPVDPGADVPQASEDAAVPASSDEKPKKPRAPRKPRKKPEPKPETGEADTPPVAAEPGDTPPPDAAE